MPQSARILPNYTYDDYVKWEGEWEIIEGIPHAMSPMASPKHQLIAGAINVELANAINRHGCKKCKVYHPIDVKIADDTVVHPDLLIVCKPIEKQFLDFPADLVVEILSPSTKLKDQITKLELYQNFGIKYYLIVDPDKQAISYYQLKKNKYEEVKNLNSFVIGESCQIDPNLSSIW